MLVFRRVAEIGNFSEVARELDMLQPTVSKHIAALEKHLNRSTHQLNLTNAGKQYYDRCVHIIDELLETESLLRNQESLSSGILLINTPSLLVKLVSCPALTISI